MRYPVSISVDGLINLPQSRNTSCSIRTFISYQRLVEECLSKTTKFKILSLEIDSEGISIEIQ